MQDLGGPNAIQDGHAGQFVPALKNRRRQRLTGGKAAPQRFELARLLLECVDHLAVKGGHAEKHGRGGAFEKIERKFGGAARRLYDDRRADPHRKCHPAANPNEKNSLLAQNTTSSAVKPAIFRP